MSFGTIVPVSVLMFAAVATSADLGGVSETRMEPERSGARLEEAQLLTRARLANAGLYSTLQSFVCHEEIERYRGDLKRTRVRFIDHVSTNVSFENGVERYQEIKQNALDRASLPEILGAWSEGEFGTLLQQTEKLIENRSVDFVAFDTLNGAPAAIYRFSVARNESPWDLEVDSEHYRIAFSTDFWISVDSGEIVKITRKSVAMPANTHITQIDWEVSLTPADLDGKTWLLPAKASYSVAYARSKRIEWNQISFSGYRHYGSQSMVRYSGF